MAKKVLIADDEEDVKAVLQMFLQARGYEVITAFDGLDAMDQVKREKPDVVLLDIMMPLIDGFEVCRKLKADPETQQIPVIMLSAAGHAGSIQKGLEVGAVDYLVKPYEPDQLLKLLQKILPE
jgi:two-component system, OmpR family, alkaline phosphatase synthesis response regulator PhoP